jgi:hypothetical protein
MAGKKCMLLLEALEGYIQAEVESTK